jgi:hypothetical protein
MLVLSADLVPNYISEADPAENVALLHYMFITKIYFLKKNVQKFQNLVASCQMYFAFSLGA